MKRFLALVIILSFACSTFGIIVNADTVSDCSDWAYPMIKKAKVANIFYEFNCPGFKKNITWDEFSYLFYLTYRVLPGSSKIWYSDMTKACFDSNYSLFMTDSNLKTEINPEDLVTREQIATVLSCMYKKYGAEEIKADISDFDDYNKVSEWAINNIELMVGLGIIKGSNNKIMPDDYATYEQTIVMLLRLYESLGGKDYVMYEDTTENILVEFDIVDESKLKSNDYVSLYDFFVMLDKARGCYSDEVRNLAKWYYGYTLAPLDHIEDSKKSLLLSLYYEGRNSILYSLDEFFEVDLDSNVSNYDVLFYIMRMLADTYSCLDRNSVDLDSYNNVEQVYKAAFEKGLITSMDIENANAPVSYKEICAILHKALFVEYYEGGSNLKLIRLYDNLAFKAVLAEEELKNKPKKIKIPVNVKINDDLSCEWTFPDEYKFIKDEKWPLLSSGSHQMSIESTDVIEYIVRHINDENLALHCTYYNLDENSEYYFDIDLSNIKIVMEDEDIKPGKYIRYKQSWYTKEVTLDNPHTFIKDCYYVLKGYEKTHRVEKYDSVWYECFKADETSNIFIAPLKGSFGVLHFDEVHIRRVKIQGNSKDGFSLYVTPESSEGFTIEESSKGRK